MGRSFSHPNGPQQPVSGLSGTLPRPGTPLGAAAAQRAAHKVWIVAIRSSSCSIVACALGGPPQSRRNSA